MIIGLQFIAVVFSFFMIYIALLNYKRNEINKIEMYVWFAIWIFTIVVSIFPDYFQPFAKRFFARTFDMMVAGAFIVVLYMTARTYLSMKKIEKKIEDLVRKDAIKDVKKGKKS